jgi:hypothetical protein
MIARRCAWVAILLALAIPLAGCARRETPKPIGAGRRLPDILSYEGVTVGTSDPLINAIAPKLNPWVVLWRHAMPFAPDSLIRVGVGPAFRTGTVQPLKDVYPPPKESAAAFRILSARSADGRYDLIFDRYQCVEESGDEIDIGGDADSAPLLLDLKRGISNQFDFCGPSSCAFQWGVWVSPTRFVLAGTLLDERNMGTRGRIQVYSTADSTVTTYVTRPVHSSKSAIYQAAWEAWVRSSYRSMKQVASRS